MLKKEVQEQLATAFCEALVLSMPHMARVPANKGITFNLYSIQEKLRRSFCSLCYCGGLGLQLLGVIELLS